MNQSGSNAGVKEASLQSLQALYRSQLKEVLKGAKHCSMALFPNQWNTGDSAIWLGQNTVLKSLGIKVTETFCQQTYFKNRINRRPDNEPILLHGGGNLGDLWLGEETLRRKILTDFPDRKIIQLPQSVHFQSLENAKQAEPIYQHPGLTIMVRDQESSTWLNQHWGIKSVMCPDAALCIQEKPIPQHPVVDVLYLCRGDKESKQALKLTPFQGSSRVVDWIDPNLEHTHATDSEEIASERYQKWIIQTAKHGRIRQTLYRRYEENLRRQLIQSRMQRGFRILSKGKVVITDRLHAHILCVLMGKPNILLDNIYGKNFSVFKQWTQGLKGTHFARTSEEALQIAETYL